MITYGNKYFPAFFSESSGIISPYSFSSIEQIAKLIIAHRELELQNGILVSVPNPNPAEGEMIEKPPASIALILIKS